MTTTHKNKDLRISVSNKLFITLSLFSLLQKGIFSDEIIEKESAKELDENAYSKIRCPKCLWQPKASSRWYCSDCDFPEYFYEACGTAWNTFDTYGKCPTCQHLWKWTTCLDCGNWSLHEDWYVSK